MKKLMATMGMAGVFAYTICSISANVQAAEMIFEESMYGQYSTNGYNLANHEKKDSALCKMLKDEKKHNTGRLRHEIEEKLNEIGIFDEEIQNFDKEMIDLLNENGFLNVQIVYSGEDDNGAMRVLEPEEVDEVIEQKYINKNTTEKSASSAVSTYSASNSDTVTSPSGMLKQYIILAQSSSSSNLIYVQYCATWVAEPFYRNTDACAVSFKNASYEPDTLKGTYYCRYIEDNLTFNRETAYSVSKNLEKYGELTRMTNGIVSEFDLYLSRTSITTASMFENIETEVSIDRINMNFYIRIENRNIDHVVVVGDYWHEESAASINPSFSYDGKTASVSISPSFESYYNHISGPYVLYLYK